MSAIRSNLRRAINWLCPSLPATDESQTSSRQPMLPGVMDLYWYRL